MSRYSGSNGGSNDSDYDSTTIKLRNYAALRLVPDYLSTNTHEQYGKSLIVGFVDTEVIDGIVFQREDKDETWKVFSAGKFFNLNPEDGLVYEHHSEEDGYEGRMSAQDILDHPRVAGFSESFGGNDYYYTPVGVVIEANEEIALNNDLDVETTDEPAIVVGDASMFVNNRPWTRTFAKKVSEQGDSIIDDNGKNGDERDENPKYDAHKWLSTDDPELREDLEDRALELWLTEEETEFDDGETATFGVPNILDVKTEEFVTIDNDDEGDDSDSDSDATADANQAAATDGGTVSESGAGSSGGNSTESPDEPSVASDSLPDGVPDSLEDLIDYMARKGPGLSADDIREFAEDEVEDPDEIDWDAAAEAANERAN